MDEQPVIGPDRIVRVSGGTEYCLDCYRDTKCPQDSDFDTMATMSHVVDGRCICCGSEVAGGNYVEGSGY